MNIKLYNSSLRGLRRALPGALIMGAAGAASAQSGDPAYQTAITDGLASANTAGVAVLAAGAVIVVSLIVWAVIKKFAHAAK